jgi:hypothetical protein
MKNFAPPAVMEQLKDHLDLNVKPEDYSPLADHASSAPTLLLRVLRATSGNASLSE